MSLDDIWAEPIVETSASVPGPSNSNAEGNYMPEATKPRSALFLSDTEDEEHTSRSPGHTSPRTAALQTMGGNSAFTGPEKAKLDEMFAGFDDDDDPFKDIAPAVNIESLKRQADARVAATSKGPLPRTSSPSLDDATRDKDKDKGNKGKTKGVIPKLDAERLLGHDGFPRLLKEYKSFKITGKGHETADLARLFRMYHAWSHKMYPKFQFRDTIDRVERLCRSRRMAVTLKVWRDEAHGITPSIGHQVSQDDDDVNGPEHDSEEEVNYGRFVPGLVSPSTSTHPPTPVTRPGSAASSAPSASLSATDIDDDMDVDALLREEEEIMREMNAAKNGTSSSYKPSNVENDENALWTAATGAPVAVPDMTMQPRLTGPTSRGEAEDEDLWNMVDAIENQPPAPEDNAAVGKAENMTAEFAAASPSAIPEQPTIGANWADMYE